MVEGLDDMVERPWDVVVVGGGNAGLVAALEATDRGARTLLLERAPRHLRGGNTRHIRNIRCVHDGDSIGRAPYPFDELWADLHGVGSGPNDEELARLTVRESATLIPWLQRHGVRWQPPLAGTLHLSRTNRFFLGGGTYLVNSYYRLAERRRDFGVLYDAAVEGLEVDADRRCQAVVAQVGGRRRRVATRAVVCASGGFEANLEWLRRYWGEAAENFIVRGTPYNDGRLLAALYELGAASAGREGQFHAIAVDARAPRFDGGIVTRLDTIPFGIVVNSRGRRFYDEGEDIWPKRYAVWGRHIAQQPDQTAMSLWDAKVEGMFLPPLYGAQRAATIGELATLLHLDPVELTRTVAEFNAAVESGPGFDMSRLDGAATRSLIPPKSNWAQRLDTPPYYGIAVRPGITFTYQGVGVTASGHVRHRDGGEFANVFAAGEIMSGNILSDGYLAGLGMTIGGVWGRIAGASAATHARG